MSLSSASNTLKRFFADHTDTVALTLDQIYISTNRVMNKPDQNKSWVANKLTHLKHYGLAEPVYTYDPRKMLTGIQLTYEGKKILGITGSSSMQPAIQAYQPVQTSLIRTVSLETIAQDIKEFEKQNPSIQLRLIVEVNKESDI